MMPITHKTKVIVFLGPIGSGKTTIAKKLQESLDNSIHISIDDFGQAKNQSDLFLSTCSEIVSSGKYGFVLIENSSVFVFEKIKQTFPNACFIMVFCPLNESLKRIEIREENYSSALDQAYLRELQIHDKYPQLHIYIFNNTKLIDIEILKKTVLNFFYRKNEQVSISRPL